jgi:septum formation protein
LKFIYLASQSPRRRQLLEQIGVRHELLLPDPHEDAEALEDERPGETPDDYVRRVTLAKCEAAHERLKRRQATHGLPEAPILCADTTVALGSQILGKPRDADDARRILRLLSGQTHRVLTAVAVNGEWLVSDSAVTWREVDDDEIDRYVASGEPMGKAGAYAIQSQAAAWMSRIDGSYSGIMGLPAFETAQLLKPLGWQF